MQNEDKTKIDIKQGIVK